MLSLLAGTECGEVLPPTTGAKPRKRGLTWGLVQDRDSAVGGILVVSQEGEKRPRTYLVTEFVPDRGWHGRCFGCRRVGAPTGYVVRIGSNRQDHGCDCPAGTYNGEPCVHVLALRAVLDNGWYPDVFAGMPAAVLPTAGEIDAMARAAGMDGDPFAG